MLFNKKKKNIRYKNTKQNKFKCNEQPNFYEGVIQINKSEK